MLADALTLLLALVVLVYGAQRAVAAAGTLAHAVGVSTFFVGVTVVAVGSSLPEIATSAYASAYGAGDVVVGHIVGSATSQITLGVGLVAATTPLVAERSQLRTYGGGMLVAMGVMAAVLLSGEVTRLEGAGMAALYVAFVATRYDGEEFDGHVERRLARVDHPRAAVVWLTVGIALVAAGGHLLVTSAESLARSLGVPTVLVGLVTGLGTTVPEIAIAVLAVRRDEAGIAVGTLLGSNITDPLFSLGVGAAVDGIAVVDPTGTMRATAYMVAVSALVVGYFYARGRLGRPAGVACAALYLPTFALV